GGVVALVFLRRERRQRLVDFDLRGTVFIFVGLVALLVAMNRIPHWGITSPALLGLIAGGVALVAAFIWRERRVPRPVLDLALLRRPALAIPTLILALQVTGHQTAMVVLPFFLVRALGLSATAAGTLFVVGAASMFAGGVAGGQLSDRLGPRTVFRATMVMVAVGALALTALDETSPLIQVAVPLAVMGGAGGMLQATASSAQLNAVPSHQIGMGSALFTAVINFSGALGATLGGILMTAGQTSALAALDQGAAVVAAAYLRVATAATLILAGGLVVTLMQPGLQADRRGETETNEVRSG
ncbi:MAG: MFS transporter, partial [Chloroflexi bacterium]|nr:MFS transporter [Chloroflexota bacterium]